MPSSNFPLLSRRRWRASSVDSGQAPFFDDPDGVSRYVFWLACAMFSCGLLFGGSGGSFGDTITQIIALPLIVLSALQWSTSRPRFADWLALALLAGIGLLAVVQLLPLPLNVWASLPGRRELLVQMQQANVAPAWLSLSLNPLATERAFEWTLPAIATFLAVRWMSPRQIRVMVLLLFAGAMLMTLMDVAFHGSGGDADVSAASVLANAYQNAATLTTTAPPATPTRSATFSGLFSNRNHFGTFLAMTIPLMVAMGLWLWIGAKRTVRNARERAAKAIAGAGGKSAKDGGNAASSPVAAAVGAAYIGLAAASMLAAAFETHSRAALLLGGLAVLGSIGLFAGLGFRRRVWWSIIGLAAGSVVVAVLTVGSAALDRFGNGVDNDMRWQIHATTLDAARHFGPMGSGLGTFVEAYQAVVQEKDMLPAIVNRAHGDYHELWLDAGVPGAVLVVVFALWLAATSFIAWRRPIDQSDDPLSLNPGLGVLARAASLSIALLLIHSFVEYPMRKTAILVVFGLCCALLAQSRRQAAGSGVATSRAGEVKRDNAPALGDHAAST